MKNIFDQLFTASLTRKHEISIIYLGRSSDFLMMTSERMVIPDKKFTLKQVLNQLRKRGGRWVCELDDSHVICTLDGVSVALSDPILVGSKLKIGSRKSVFEQ